MAVIIGLAEDRKEKTGQAAAKYHFAGDGAEEHLPCLLHRRDCATCCAACSQVFASGEPLSAVTADWCANCCDHCAKACAAFPDDQHMEACAEKCRKWKKTCKAIAK